MHGMPGESPRIRKFAWGKVEVEGCTAPYKDAKLFPGGSRAWDWQETGTKHAPGIQPADVEELLEHGATVIVLARGLYERLQICPETLQMLKEKDVTVEVLPTEDAVKRYNALAESQPVGALIHSTC
jgi:hypothetical protein